MRKILFLDPVLNQPRKCVVQVFSSSCRPAHLVVRPTHSGWCPLIHQVQYGPDVDFNSCGPKVQVMVQDHTADQWLVYVGACEQEITVDLLAFRIVCNLKKNTPGILTLELCKTLHSLKLTVRSWKLTGPQKETSIPTIHSSGTILVSGRIDLPFRLERYNKHIPHSLLIVVHDDLPW